MAVRVKYLQVLKDKLVPRRASAWLALPALLFMWAAPVSATETTETTETAETAESGVVVPQRAELPEAIQLPAVPDQAERPAVPDVTLESGWLLVDEESGTERLVPEPPLIGPAEILYTGRFRYPGAEPATGLRIEIPVPEGVHYVAGSATGPGAAVTYSVDGVVFAPAGQLRVPTREEERQEDVQASPRRAAPEDYGFIRWDLPGAFPPGAAGLVSFRARPMIDEPGRDMPVVDDGAARSPESESVADEAPPQEAP